MGWCSVVQPEVVRLSLSHGDYIDVKRELNAGEYWDLLGAQASSKRFALILAYVVGWSFTGMEDRPVPYDLDAPEATRDATIGGLKVERLHELIAAIQEHKQTQEAAAKKNATMPGGAPASAATSPSVA